MAGPILSLHLVFLSLLFSHPDFPLFHFIFILLLLLLCYQFSAHTSSSALANPILHTSSALPQDPPNASFFGNNRLASFSLQQRMLSIASTA